MATEQPVVPINGNYAPQQTQGFGAPELNYTSPAAKAPTTTTTTTYGEVPLPTANPASTATENPTELPSEEVGWYFVERYYTTLSRQPEKLFLFYQKRSQFVSGVEAEKAPVCVGQKAINDRIKELDIQDCKVRVTNVDSQSSDSSIVIQVIGEISNKSAPHRKFTQTFVLAKQTNGYYVLNDIFRYIIEDEEFEGNGDGEELQQNQALPSGTQEPVPSIEETEPKTLTSSSDPIAQEHDAAQVDRELEEKVLKEEAPPIEDTEVPVNGTAEEEEDIPEAEDAPVAAVPIAPEETVPAVETQTEAAATQELAPEKPKDPEPTPATSTPPVQTAPPPAAASTTAAAAPAAAAPAAPPKPAAPKTWATLAAAANNRIATPVTPAVRSTPPPAGNQAKPAAPAQVPTGPAPAAPTAPTASTALTGPAVPTAPSAQTNSTEAATVPSPQDEWQSVNHDHNKRQTRVQQAPAEQQNSRAYIKNVYESVDGDELKKTLEKYGELAYFDISRQKNCAFVDFATPAGYQAAVAANPHMIGNDRIIVEERRLRPGSYPYVPRGRGDMRGGRGGNGPRDGGRGGFQQKPAFAPRGRGNNIGARGRGAPQPA